MDSPYRVRGLMLGNHTGMGGVLQRMLRHFDQLWHRGVFLENYKKHAMFREGMEEFVSSREVVEGVVRGYKGVEETMGGALVGQ